MINFLFNLLLITTLLIAFLIVLIGAVWVLSYEINTMLDVDILFKVKRKAREIAYGKEIIESWEELKSRFPNRDNITEETEEH